MQERFYEEPKWEHGVWLLLPTDEYNDYPYIDMGNHDSDPKIRYPFVYAQSKEFLLKMRDAVYRHAAKLTVKEWNEYFRGKGLAVASPWLDD